MWELLGAGSRRNCVDTFRAGPFNRAAKVKSFTAPLSMSSVARSPSPYSMKHAAGLLTSLGSSLFPTKSWVRPSVTDQPRGESLRESAEVSNSFDQRPSSPDFQTASPSIIWTAFTPVSPPARRSIMHCMASSA